LKPASTLQYLSLRYFSRPPHRRQLYRQIAQRKIRSIVEFGISDGTRALQMLKVALRNTPAEELRYTGIDLFEAADNASTISLKEAHRILRPTGVRLQLIPGDPFSALARSANSLANTDLMLINEPCDAASLEKSWFFMPRMLHAGSLILREETAGAQPAYQTISVTQMETLAAARPVRRAA